MQYAMLCDLLTVRTVVLSQKNNTLTYLLPYLLTYLKDNDDYGETAHFLSYLNKRL